MTRGRRFVLAVTSLLLAAPLFHAQLADALVTRGDEFLYRGNTSAAKDYYARALGVDGTSEAAADRFVFFSVQNRTERSLKAAITVASRYLSRVPSDAPLLEDRAMCYQYERRYDLARADFERAARLTHDPRYYTFAGWAAKRSGKRAAAVKLWLAALHVDPHFLPARRALREAYS